MTALINCHECGGRLAHNVFCSQWRDMVNVSALYPSVAPSEPDDLTRVQDAVEEVKRVIRANPGTCLDAETTLRLVLATSILHEENKKMLDLLWDSLVGDQNSEWRAKVREILAAHGRRV